MSDPGGDALPDAAKPTFSGPLDPRTSRRDRLARRIILGLIAVFVAAGAAGLLGVRISTATASGAGYHLAVTYAAVTRSGLATPWSVEVRRAGGFDGPVTLATTRGYWQIFDANALYPDPGSATMRGDKLVWTFEPPEGETLSVLFDARAGPSIQGGHAATTEILVHGAPVVEVSYRTLVVP
jgi:hypothetical protein